MGERDCGSKIPCPRTQDSESQPGLEPGPLDLGPVVRKSVNANPGLKVKRGFDFCCIKAYIKANVLWGFNSVKGKTEGNKI